MGRACNRYWGEDMCTQVLMGNLCERDHWKDLAVDGRCEMTLKWIFKKWDGN
jgi:hypothetical protein